MENTYWNGKGKYQEDYERLLELMPASGKAATVAGELIRSMSRLSYDFYNNGMGNNTSGALAFLHLQGVFDNEDDDECIGVIHPYTRGRTYGGNYDGDKLQAAMEKMVDLALKHIKDNPELEIKPNEQDMLDLNEELEYEDEDEDEDCCPYCGL